MSIPVVEAYLVPSDTSCDTPAPVQGLASHKQVSRAPTVHPPTEVPPQLHELLDRHTWPIGIKRLFLSNISMYHKRYFILDDSSSMMSNDGERLMGEGKKRRFFPCSRWSELTASMQFHAELAKYTPTHTEFRFLNKGLPAVFGTGSDNDSSYNELMGHLDGSPGGVTPLVAHIGSIVQEIQVLLPELRATGRKVVLVIASDGEASDGDVGRALAPLQHLPVWVVIRLCTNEEKIRDYWNRIDNDLELEMDVLDDFQAESEEIYEHNPWLNYGEPLHRLREWGVDMKEIDLLDEALLSADQMKAVCIKFFSPEPNILKRDVPEPATNWNEFAAWLSNLLRNDKTWNPHFERMSPWVDMRILKEKYGNGGSVACNIM